MPIITQVAAPAPQSTGSSNSASEGRQRAIALLSGASSQSQATPVANATNITPEESGAIKRSPDQIKQTDTGEGAVETASQEATDEPTSKPEEQPLSSQYAVLARKEKALRARVVATEQQFKQREAALAAKEAEQASKATQDLTNYISKDKLKQNAYSVLSEMGISYDDISQQALTAQSPDAQYLRQVREELKAELQQIKDEQVNTRKNIEQQQAEAYQQAINQIKTEVKQLVYTDPSFETVKETGSVNDVVELIERTFKEDGTLLTVEQAAQAVEDHLIEEALKMSRIKKISDRLKPATPKQSNTPTTATPGEPKQITTLTNSVGSTRVLSGRERALLAFKGELK